MAERKIEEKIELVDLKNFRERFPLNYGGFLIDSRLINEQGIRVSGVGMIVRKLEELIKLQDEKTNVKLHFIEKRLAEILEELQRNRKV